MMQLVDIPHLTGADLLTHRFAVGQLITVRNQTYRVTQPGYLFSAEAEVNRGGRQNGRRLLLWALWATLACVLFVR